MVKLIDVAREAGVSPATVSRVLNGSVLVTDEKRQMVLDAVEKLGYVPLRPLAADRAEKSEPEKICVEEKPRFILTIHGQISEMQRGGISWTARELGYQVISAPVSENWNADAANLTQTIKSLQEHDLLAGVMLCSSVLQPEEHLMDLLNKVPVVQIGRHLPLENSAVASVEDQQMVYEAVKYLVSCGKTRPAIFVRSVQPDAPVYEQRRIWGYRLALMELGLDPAAMLVREVDDTLEGGIEEVNKLLAAGCKPDAVLCSSDLTALGCVKAFAAHGWQIPEQVAILGLEDSGAGLMSTPELSTIGPPQMVAAETATRLLHQLITGAAGPGYIAPLPYQLIIRETSQEQQGKPVHQWQKDHWVDT